MAKPIDDKICIFVDCSDEQEFVGWKFCQFHKQGGELGNGETYDQYQIIEQDFIDFIKVVPISDTAHFKVHSPVLRDIIIRSCVQIELFLKEWSKYYCSKNQESLLYKKYFEISKKTQEHKGVRNWNFGDYYCLRTDFSTHRKVFVRPLQKSISPFDSWKSEKEPPTWWNIYNSIKHDGMASKEDANLENALYSLAALFLLHCENSYSRSFLDQYRNTTISYRFNDVKIKFHSITSPIDSKRYLFKEDSSNDNEVEIATTDRLKKYSTL